jgi:hypothetical protein
VSDRIARLSWLVLFGFALLEVAAHAATRARVPSHADWRAAAAFVRAELRPRDLIASAPDWTDPVLRNVLGDVIDLGMAGRSDTAGYERMWALRTRGAQVRDAPRRAPDASRAFGRVTVDRWDLGPTAVRFDLVENVREATVRIGAAGRDCPWRSFSLPRGGGLGLGTLYPTQRFACDKRRNWLWVAPIVLEDLDLQPRRCVWQHPAGKEPIRVRFENAPLGDRVVLYGGIYYEHERMRKGGPVFARVLVDGQSLGYMQHDDGDGWKRASFDTRKLGRERGDLTIEVSAPQPHLRSFCWAATVREGRPNRATAANEEGVAREAKR